MPVYPIEFSAFFQMNSRDEPEKTFKVAMPDNAYSTVYLRDAMSVEEFLASACARRSLNPMEHFVRVKKRRDMEDHNYFVPHRNDLIENYVSNLLITQLPTLPHQPYMHLPRVSVCVCTYVFL